MTDIINSPYTGPALVDLPATRRWDNGEGVEDVPFTPAARAYWEVVRSMPHAALWTASDWQYAVDSIVIRDSYERTGSITAMTEMGRRDRVLGMTRDSRIKLDIHYITPEPSAAERAAAQVAATPSEVAAAVDSILGY